MLGRERTELVEKKLHNDEVDVTIYLTQVDGIFEKFSISFSFSRVDFTTLEFLFSDRKNSGTKKNTEKFET